MAKRNFEGLFQDYQNFHSWISSQNTIVVSPNKIVSLVPSYILISPQTLPSSQNPHIVMANRYAPLVLPGNIHELPQGYAQRLKQFGEEADIIAQQHLDRFLDFIYLEEVDHKDVNMRLFSKSLYGEVKKRFRELEASSIINFQQFEEMLLRKWEENKNPIQLLTQYN